MSNSCFGDQLCLNRAELRDFFFSFFFFPYTGYQLLRAPPVGMIFACMTVFIPPQGQPHSDFGEMHAGCVSVAGTGINYGHQRQDLLIPSLIFDACVLRIDLGLYSHPKE